MTLSTPASEKLEILSSFPPLLRVSLGSLLAQGCASWGDGWQAAGTEEDGVRALLRQLHKEAGKERGSGADCVCLPHPELEERSRCMWGAGWERGEKVTLCHRPNSQPPSEAVSPSLSPPLTGQEQKTVSTC